MPTLPSYPGSTMVLPGYVQGTIADVCKRFSDSMWYSTPSGALSWFAGNYHLWQPTSRESIWRGRFAVRGNAGKRERVVLSVVLSGIDLVLANPVVFAHESVSGPDTPPLASLARWPAGCELQCSTHHDDDPRNTGVSCRPGRCRRRRSTIGLVLSFYRLAIGQNL